MCCRTKFKFVSHTLYIGEDVRRCVNIYKTLTRDMESPIWPRVRSGNRSTAVPSSPIYPIYSLSPTPTCVLSFYCFVYPCLHLYVYFYSFFVNFIVCISSCNFLWLHKTDVYTYMTTSVKWRMRVCMRGRSVLHGDVESCWCCKEQHVQRRDDRRR